MQLKRFFWCAAFAMLALSSPVVQAADMMVRKAPVRPDPAFDWTGFYVGAQGGHQWGRDRTTEFFTATGLPSGFSRPFDFSSGFGGGHAGYNYQLGKIVLGIEADAEAVSAQSGFSLAGGIFQFSARQDWQATIRGRLGVTPVNRLLLYVTGGAAFTELKYSWSVDPAVPLGVARVDANLARVGWTVGGGGEVAFTDHVTARLEYRYADFGEPRFNWPDFGATYREQPRFHQLRGAVSYKF
jgi:outer membrane immunogenic protein